MDELVCGRVKQPNHVYFHNSVMKVLWIYVRVKFLWCVLSSRHLVRTVFIAAARWRVWNFYIAASVIVSFCEDSLHFEFEWKNSPQSVSQESRYITIIVVLLYRCWIYTACITFYWMCECICDWNASMPSIREDISTRWALCYLTADLMHGRDVRNARESHHCTFFNQWVVTCWTSDPT